uniref:Probable JmjC domain-containing histone demethylation protein 2C n=1 Tax=Oryzias latipes TaxID=8090 RepID=A0A3P9JE77_ORYLA
MAVEARPELVGKRFLCVGGDEPPELGTIARWPWRSGVIRAVNHRDGDTVDLTVYVEFDDQEWEKREWVKVYEDFQLFLLEHQLVWAKRKEGAAGGAGAGGLLPGTKAKHIQWPALAFKPVVGKNLLSSVTAVEFLLDRKLDFLSEHSACQPYQDEVDSQNPLFRDNPQLHEEVKSWLKDQKVQEIFMQGPYSLNGYRVRVYRQDSATQWFTGIITHHDLFSRNMVVMNDQVLEPQNVDPSMVQMTFLDDVVHSLLKGENIGITSRRRSRSSQNSNTAHMAGGRPCGTTGNSQQSHYTRAQANSPRPVMTSSGPNPKSSPQQQSQSQQVQLALNPLHHSPGGSGREQREPRASRSSRRKGSDSSVPEEDKEAAGRESKAKVKQTMNKRRKGEEDEKKAGLKRLKTEVTSDLSDCSDSENLHNKRNTDSSCCSSSSSSLSSSSSSSSSSSEVNSENELKMRISDEVQSTISQVEEEEEKPGMKGPKMNDSSSLVGHLSPWADMEAAEKLKKSVLKESVKMMTKEEEELVAVTQITQSPLQPSQLMVDMSQGGALESVKNAVKAPGAAVIDITDDAQATVHRESSEAVSALLASQKAESTALSPYLPLNPSPVSSPPVPPASSPSEGCRRTDVESHAKQHGFMGGGVPSAKSNKIEFGSSEVIRSVSSTSDSLPLTEKSVPPHPQQQHEQRQYTSTPPSTAPPFSNEGKKLPPHKTNTSAPTDLVRSKTSPGPNPSSSHFESLKQKSPSTPQNQHHPDLADLKVKPSPGLLDVSKPRPNTSPDISKHKITRYSEASPPPARLPTKEEPAEPQRSGFKPVAMRSEAGATDSSTKSPLIIDKNETFTVYRDPALVQSDAESSSNHVAAYLHPHLHPLHPSSPHSPCLTPASHPHATSHLLAPPHSSALPHPHLLASGMLPAMPPPATSLLGSHARLESPGSLGHLALAHPAATHQQQFLQGHGRTPGLSLYPILWQYPNGTPASYPPGLNLPPTPKWVHSETPVSSDAPLRRNTTSPWLHQAASDSLGLLNHIPVRPASADAHRPPGKMPAHSNPSMTKASLSVQKETLAQLKQDQVDRSRTPAGKDVLHHRLYLDPHSTSRLGNPQEAGQGADRAVKYKEENRQILKESIEVAPFTAKIQRSMDPLMDRERTTAFPVPVRALTSQSPKASLTHPNIIHQEKSNYFTTLSNSVVNEPPRLYPSKEMAPYYEKVSAGIVTSVGAVVPSQGLQSLGNYSSKASLSKPPPLIKHQPEGGEGLAGKITEQLSQQVTLVQQQHHASVDRMERCSPAISSSSNHHQQQHHQLRTMPSLYRAPVFHPPTQQALDCKEAVEREKEWERERAGFGGRLSPPTLTPIQPVSLPLAGTKTLVEQQKPPTLLPELRDIKSHRVGAAVTSVAPTTSGDVTADGWRGRTVTQGREAVFSRERDASRGKSPAAVASVIVGPTSAKYDSLVGANRSGAIIHKEPPSGRFYPSKLEGESARFGESPREPGVRRVIQSNMDAKCQSSFVHGLLSSSSPLNRSAVLVSSAVDLQNKTLKSAFSSRDEVPHLKAGVGGWPLGQSSADKEGENHVAFDSHARFSGLSLLQTNSTGASLPSQSPTSPSYSVSGSSQPYSSSFIHLKKHKAALAAAQSRTSLPTAPPSGSPTLSESSDKTPNHTSTPPPSFSQASSSSESSSSGSAAGRSTPGKSSPVPNGQTMAAAGCGQPINYHKLKKAWLTRHSEEDKNTTATTSSTTTKAEKLLTTTTSSCSTTAMSDMIRPCTVNLSASTSSEVDMSKEGGSRVERERQAEEKSGGEDRKSRRGHKRSYDSGSETAGDDSDGSESKMEGRAKRQPKPTYKKKQNDMARRRGDADKDDDDGKPNGIFRSAREKTKLKLASSNGIPRSVLKDWRKVKKLKQTGESFLQDDSCSEIGPNLQKCRECRVVRSKKGEEPTHSPVFCRFYYFRRLSFSKNGVIRMDGFSAPDQFDDEALALWVPGAMEDAHLDKTTAKYILGFIGDKFCQMVVTENTAASWVKKDAKMAWKRAVRGVREMCDACEATLFNIHWVCQKCGFVVCLDCYKAKERKSSKDKELYVWLKCVKGQPHDHKHLMPTQIIPGTALTELVTSMHFLRDKHNIRSCCSCTSKQNALNKLPVTNGVSQVLQNVLNHSNKLALVKAEPGSLQNSEHGGIKADTNGSGGGGSSPGSDAGRGASVTPPESQSPLHFLADLAEQKSREEKKENHQSALLGKALKEDKDGDALEVLQQCKTTSLGAGGAEQGSTLRDLLTTTAGKLKLGSTDAGIAFAPVYSTASQTGKGGQAMPNILDDIIASVVENKIPASRQSITTTKLSIKQDQITMGNNSCPAAAVTDDAKADRKKPTPPAAPTPEDSVSQHPGIPHSWLSNRRLLWLRDHRNQNNWKLFRECWRKGQPVLVSGIHKRLNASLWKADSFNQEFADHQGDLLNCKDQVVSNSGIKEFWDGFEDLTKRPKSKDGEPLVYRLKDWPSGEEFMALMPSRYDDLMKNLPLPEYSDPEGALNLASHLPSFFVRPDLGPRLCCAYGVAASQEQDFGTANLHLEVSDVVSVLVYVGVAKGNGVLSKTGVLKRLEEEDLDEGVRKRLKDSSETPGALWHIYLNKDVDRIQEFLHKLSKEQGSDPSQDQDPVREQAWYLSRKQRQRLLDEHGVHGWTIVQFLGDSVLVPAGAMHQIQNLHSCVQVINDFVSPEHVVKSFHLTQELRANKEEVNYEDKLQVKNILYHCVKEAVSSLKRSGSDKDADDQTS